MNHESNSSWAKKNFGKFQKILAKWLEENNNQCTQAREEENTNHKIQFAAQTIWSYLSDKTETVLPGHLSKNSYLESLKCFLLLAENNWWGS